MGTVASEYDSYIEGEVDLKAELIRALEQLRNSRMKNNSLKDKLSKYQGEQNFNKNKNFYSKEDNDNDSKGVEILFIGTTNLDEE